MLTIADRLAELDCSTTLMRLPELGTKPAGWDVADAITEGLRGADLLRYITTQSTKFSAPTTRSDAAGQALSATQHADNDEWRDRLSRRHGLYEASLHNVSLILAHAPAWHGVLAYDRFNAVVVKLCAPPWQSAERGEWSDLDDAHTVIWLEANRMRPVGSPLVSEAVEVVAHRRLLHPVCDYLEGLVWDGVERLDTWLAIYLGTSDTPYTRKVGRYFLIGMVTRVFVPGCKFDYMLVLEGPQGQGKTAALQILGGAWFGNTDLHLGDKDSMLGLRGKWLYEIAELDALARVEATRQKSFISRQTDEVRPPFGRRTRKLPRQVVFAGTTNSWEWNKDPTGGRRFWSLATGDIDLVGLAAIRDQLFAEAVHRHHAGERCYPDRAEQAQWFDPEQLQRMQPEPFEELIAAWICNQAKDQFALSEVITDALKVPAAQMQSSLTSRVGVALRRLGCVKIERRTQLPRYVYQRPAALTAPAADPDAAPAAGAASPAAEDDPVPF